MRTAISQWTSSSCRRFRCRLRYGLLIMGHGRRQVLWFGITAHTTADWIANQLIEACGWEQIPRYLIWDRDRAFGEIVIHRGLVYRRSRPPDGFLLTLAQRSRRTVDRLNPEEVIDHVVVFGERHLRHVLPSYKDDYNATRTHLSLNKDAGPAPSIWPDVIYGRHRRPVISVTDGKAASCLSNTHG